MRSSRTSSSRTSSSARTSSKKARTPRIPTVILIVVVFSVGTSRSRQSANAADVSAVLARRWAVAHRGGPNADKKLAWLPWALCLTRVQKDEWDEWGEDGAEDGADEWGSSPSSSKKKPAPKAAAPVRQRSGGGAPFATPYMRQPVPSFNKAAQDVIDHAHLRTWRRVYRRRVRGL